MAAIVHQSNRRADDKFRKFAERISVDSKSKCWNWVGTVKSNGYGSFTYGCTQWRTQATVHPHRFSYEMYRGPIRSGMEIDHLCKNTRCVNPRHLEQVTRAENMKRGENGSKTHCKRGHEFDLKNTYLMKGGNWIRACRRCHTADMKIRYWMKRGVTLTFEQAGNNKFIRPLAEEKLNQGESHV